MELQRPDSTSPQRILEGQKGFALLFLLSFLPVVVAGILILYFSQLLTSNWMQASHICRTELLKVQKVAGSRISELLKLNPQARLLRRLKTQAQLELATAIALQNPAMIAKANSDLIRIKTLQSNLDLAQRFIVERANLEMTLGLQKAAGFIRRQSQVMQSRNPRFIQFEIRSVRTVSQSLAVYPDRTDIAPVYELKEPFQETQALSVSWIAQFQTVSTGGASWIRNQHHKQGACAASLTTRDKMTFSEVLTGDRSFLKL